MKTPMTYRNLMDCLTRLKKLYKPHEIVVFYSCGDSEVVMPFVILKANEYAIKELVEGRAIVRKANFQEIQALKMTDKISIRIHNVSKWLIAYHPIQQN